jgi:hypothetical protein
VPRHTLTLTLVQQLRLLLVLYRGLARGPWCLESRPKAAARLDLEVAAGWASLSSHGLWRGDAWVLSTGTVPPALLETLKFSLG